MIIGIDPHKASHTATALDPATNTPVSSLRVDAGLAGYRELLRWGRQFPERRSAIENAKGLGCHLAQGLSPGMNPSSMSLPRRRPGCGSCRVAGAARTM